MARVFISHGIHSSKFLTCPESHRNIFRFVYPLFLFLLSQYLIPSDAFFWFDINSKASRLSLSRLGINKVPYYRALSFRCFS